jgi:hypothetical protein
MLGLGVLLGAGACAQLRPSGTQVASGPSGDADLGLPRLPDEYHVKIERAPAPLFFGWNPFADFAASPPTSQQVRDCVPIVVSELTRYPPAFLDRIRLKKVRL